MGKQNLGGGRRRRKKKRLVEIEWDENRKEEEEKKKKKKCLTDGYQVSTVSDQTNPDGDLKDVKSSGPMVHSPETKRVRSWRRTHG